jgi:hypothetical protein
MYFKFYVMSRVSLLRRIYRFRFVLDLYNTLYMTLADTTVLMDRIPDYAANVSDAPLSLYIE